MEKLKIAICDDDEIFALEIKEIIDDLLLKMKVKASSVIFASGEKVIKYVVKEKIDLIFLNLIMPEKSGFKVAESIYALRKECSIIFVTEQNDLVYESFMYHPFGFIRKMYCKYETENVLKYYISEKKKNSICSKFHTVGEKQEILLKEIIYLESQCHRIIIHMKNKNLAAWDILECKEKELEQYGFIRVHQGYLVNKFYIELMKDNQCILKNGICIPISRQRKKQAKERFMFY